MTDATQPEALRIADAVFAHNKWLWSRYQAAHAQCMADAAYELRRLHAECERLRDRVAALATNGVELELSLDASANTIESLRAQLAAMTRDRDSWVEQAGARVAEALEFAEQRDAARAEVEALRSQEPQP